MKKNTISGKINYIYDDSSSTTALDSSLIDGHGPLVPNINFSSAFSFDNETALANYHSNKHSLQRYSRDSNLMVLQLEKIFSSFYDSNSILFSSGMAAIWSVLWSIAPKVNTFVTFGSFYRKTLINMEDICKVTGAKHVNYQTLDQFKISCPTSDDVCILVESPSNPFLKVSDISDIRSCFPSATIVYDNTLAGMLNDKNDLKEIDFVVNSLTKYVSGHNDVIAGAVWAPDDVDFDRLWDIRSSQGGILDPMSAYLLFRSLKTYDIRIEKSIHNCKSVLEQLSCTPCVEEIYYPGEYMNKSERQVFSDSYFEAGSVVTFKVSSSVDLAAGLASLHSSKMAPSFGSTDTLIERPATMSHAGKSAEELKKLGLDFGHVRMSVGLEPLEFIENDLKRLFKVEK